MIALIAVTTFILFARAFRSLLLPAKAILLNVLSVAAAWGVMVLVWEKGYGSELIWGIPATGSVPSWLPLMTFAFLFGLSMEYVFILSRMRRNTTAPAAPSSPSCEASAGGIGRTGRLVTSAALILFLAFIAMASGPGTDLKMFATALATGILVDATMIRALIVPAVILLMGRWNWWLPRSLRGCCGSSRRCHHGSRRARPVEPLGRLERRSRTALKWAQTAATAGWPSSLRGVPRWAGARGNAASTASPRQQACIVNQRAAVPCHPRSPWTRTDRAETPGPELKQTLGSPPERERRQDRVRHVRDGRAAGDRAARRRTTAYVGGWGSQHSPVRRSRGSAGANACGL